MILFKKKNVAILVLVSFLMIAFFGLIAMTHTSDADMVLDCPLSTTGVSLCPTDLSTAAIHHLSSYSSFFNFPAVSTLVVLLLFLLALSLSLLLAGSLLLLPAVYTERSPCLPAPVPNNLWLTRWLARLENSPSVF